MWLSWQGCTTAESVILMDYINSLEGHVPAGEDPENNENNQGSRGWVHRARLDQLRSFHPKENITGRRKRRWTGGYFSHKWRLLQIDENRVSRGWVMGLRIVKEVSLDIRNNFQMVQDGEALEQVAWGRMWTRIHRSAGLWGRGWSTLSQPGQTHPCPGTAETTSWSLF